MIRAARRDDLPAMRDIFACEVETSTSSYERYPPSAEDFAARYDRVLAGGYHWLVSECDGDLAGYAYYSSFRDRWGYRHTVENSVYVATRHRARGVGRRLLQALIDQAAQQGFRQMLAVIGDAANEPTLRLHAACGFRTIGVAEGVGEKFDRTLDLVIMQRGLAQPSELIASTTMLA